MEEQGPELEFSAQGKRRKLTYDDFTELLAATTNRDLFYAEARIRLTKAFENYMSAYLRFETKVQRLRHDAGNGRVIASVAVTTAKTIFRDSALEGHAKLERWIDNEFSNTSLPNWLEEPVEL